MANDSGLNPVTPNSSVCSCTAVPITPCSRPSPPASHNTGHCAPGTLARRQPWGCRTLGAVSPHPLLTPAGDTNACAGLDPASPGIPGAAAVHCPQGDRTSGKAISGFGDPAALRCLVPAWPGSLVPVGCRLRASPRSAARAAACGSAVPALYLRCPKKLTKLKLFSFLRKAFK